MNLNMCVKRLYNCPPGLHHKREMSGIKLETGDAGWRTAYGMDEDSTVGVKGEREQGGIFSGVQMETGECNRAFFHECLLKAPSGRGHRGARSVKVSLQWHVPSGSVLQ